MGQQVTVGHTASIDDWSLGLNSWTSTSKEAWICWMIGCQCQTYSFIQSFTYSLIHSINKYLLRVYYSVPALC